MRLELNAEMTILLIALGFTLYYVGKRNGRNESTFN